MQASHEQNVPFPRRFALAASIFLAVSAMGFLQPFTVVYQSACGLSAGKIGLIAGIGNATVLLIQPLIGRLSDRIDSRRPLMALSSMIAGLSYYGFSQAHSFSTFLLLTIAALNGVAFLNVAAGVIVGRIAHAPVGAGRAYAGYRVWGSIGYVIVALGTGLLLRHVTHLDRVSLAPIFVYGPMVYALVAVASIFVPDPKVNHPVSLGLATPPETGGGRGDVGQSDRSDDLSTAHSPREQLRNLQMFFVAFFLYSFAMSGGGAYLGLYMKRLGESAMWISGTYALGVICEVLVMMRIGRLSDRFGRRPALAVAFLALAVRQLLYVVATGPLWVLAVQTMHGLNFGITGAISVVFVNDLASRERRGVAQARLAGVTGLAASIAPMACGFLADHFGMRWMFAAMASIAAGGTILFLSQVHESHPSPESLEERCHPILRPFARLLTAPR